MIRHRAHLALAALLLALAGCTVTTAPINHLQLDEGDTAIPRNDTPVILISRVALPDYLLRNELIVRRDETTLRYDPYMRWAEPLDLGIQRVLARQLGRLLDTRQVVRSPAEARRTEDYRLQVEVLNFESNGRSVVLRATGRWERGDGDETLGSVVFEDQLALAGDSMQVAQALSELLARFSGKLAAALSRELSPTPLSRPAGSFSQ